ncbi:MAG: hypothetical protein IPK80_19665 [Nannocystis sp.]|nr:hypothetical protein [Nannocystis sp.]
MWGVEELLGERLAAVGEREQLLVLPGVAVREGVVGEGLVQLRPEGEGLRVIVGAEGGEVTTDAATELEGGA